MSGRGRGRRQVKMFSCLPGPRRTFREISVDDGTVKVELIGSCRLLTCFFFFPRHLPILERALTFISRHRRSVGSIECSSGASIEVAASSEPRVVSLRWSLPNGDSSWPMILAGEEIIALERALAFAKEIGAPDTHSH